MLATCWDIESHWRNQGKGEDTTESFVCVYPDLLPILARDCYNQAKEVYEKDALSAIVAQSAERLHNLG